MRFSELEKLRVGILGTGREGQAVWRQIRRRYPDKPLALFSESPVDEAFVQITDSAVDHFHAGALDVAALGVYDVLIRSAGISPYRAELRELRSRGVCFTTATNIWFAENPDARTICISGTLGKSTTASLTAHLLRHAGLDVCLAGNIGLPMLDVERSPDWWVIELSSYQISDLVADVTIAVFLNLSEEHIDWHGGLQHYRSDKLKLAQMASHGHVIANQADKTLTGALEDIKAVNWFNAAGGWCADCDSVLKSYRIEPGDTGRKSKMGTRDFARLAAPPSLPGQHNMHNLAAALTIMDLLGLEQRTSQKALDTFMGLPHRLQLLGTRSGIRYVNDSISTTPVSVTAALETLGCRDLVLLLGGLDRGLDWKPFAAGLKQATPHTIITLPDNGPNIQACLLKEGISPAGGIHTAAGLQQAVEIARQLVPQGGCILLSPGAPSFPHFRDFEDRGDRFRSFAGF